MSDWTNATISRQELLRRTAKVAAGVGVLGFVGATGAACGGTSSSGSSSSSDSPSTGSKGTSAGPKPDGDLLLFNWAQYMSPAVISGFEKTYGVKVNQTYFDNMDGMLAKLNAGVRFDIILPEAAYADRLVNGKKLLQIDHTKLKNYDGVLEAFKDPWYDKDSAHTIPYALWTTGIGWRKDKVTNMTGSWNDLWSHPEAKGSIWLLDDVREVLGMSLMRNGNDINSTDSGQIAKATDAILQLMPSVRGFTSVNNQFVNGTSFLQHIWSGQLWQTVQLAKNPEDFAYETVPEKTPLNSDTVAIPANAPHPGTAMLFLDWILTPENVAQNVKVIGYPQGTNAGLEAYNTIVKDYPYLEMETSNLQSGKHFEPLSPKDLSAWSAGWLKIKAA